MIHRTLILALLATIASLAEAQSQAAKPLTREQEDALFLANACEPTSVDTTSWPRYRIGDVTIAVPAQYQVSRRIPNTLIFRGSYGSLSVTSHRNTSLYALSGPNRASSRPRPKETWCDDASYGGYRTEVHAFIEQGRYNFSAKWEATWGSGDESEWISASFGTSRPEEANRLRAALNTMQPIGRSGKQIRGQFQWLVLESVPAGFRRYVGLDAL